MREVCNPLPAAPLIALLLGQPALASPPPWIKDTRGTDLDAELDQLSPESREKLAPLVDRIGPERRAFRAGAPGPLSRPA